MTVFIISKSLSSNAPFSVGSVHNLAVSDIAGPGGQQGHSHGVLRWGVLEEVPARDELGCVFNRVFHLACVSIA